VQGSDPLSKRISDYPNNYTAPTAFADQMNSDIYPLYLDTAAYNPLIDLRSSSNGIEAFATAVGLRKQDLFGTCLAIFLMLAAAVTLLSLLIWAVHGLWEYIAAGKVEPNKRMSMASRTSSLGAKELLETRNLSRDFGALPHLASTTALGRLPASSRPRRTWNRFRLKGEAGAFHSAALYGNLLRLILIFHLPITLFSIYQLTLDTASIASRILAAFAFVFISVTIPIGIMYKVYRTPTGKLYDATRTLLSMGTMYNVYEQEKQMFRVIPLAASLVTGVVVGAGQKSGIVQTIILIIVELVLLIVPVVWVPWGEGASMGLPNAFLSIVRLATMVIVMVLSPTVSASWTD
jgi:hypothetical protein